MPTAKISLHCILKALVTKRYERILVKQRHHMGYISFHKKGAISEKTSDPSLLKIKV